MTVVPSRAVPENDAARFLESSVGIDEACADDAGSRPSMKRVRELVEPGSLGEGVVVEEQHMTSLRDRRTGIRRTQEPQVLVEANIDQAWNVPKVPRCISGRVVDQHDLERRGVPALG